MKSACLLAAGLILGFQAYTQEIHLTFSCTGESTRIDSIRATNLTTGKSITFPGNATLILTQGSGIPEDPLINAARFYPNPFDGQALLSVQSAMPQLVSIVISDMTGRVLAQSEQTLSVGEQNFAIRTASPGIFLIGVKGEGVNSTMKVICLNTKYLHADIESLGLAGPPDDRTASHKIGSLVPGYQLPFNTGDMLSFRIMSGELVTIFTDSPTGSRNMEVEMFSCTDAGGNNYPVVKIGDQVWMGKNLYYLPSVSPAASGSTIEPSYYVYGYQGSDAGAARGTQNFRTYGVLYNWEAAQSACPEGWHLPNDLEWMTLERFLGMSPEDNSGYGWRNSGLVGGQLKETGTLHWYDPNTAASDGIAFTALPGGYRGLEDGFFSLGFRAYFWTSTQGDQTTGFYRGLYYELGGIDRNNESRTMGFSVRCLRNDPFYVQLPDVITLDPSDIMQTTTTSGGNVTDDGGADVTARGVCWNTSGSPTLADDKTLDGSGTGSFTSYLTGLTPETPYFMRAYATNSEGTAYGEEKQFTTAAQEVVLPTVTTYNASDILQTTATSGGNVTDDGGADVTARGVCWNTSGSPTLADDKTLDGSGTGSFTSYLTGLTQGTPYYIRGYATNSKGTAYGEEKQFSTAGDTEGTLDYAGKTYGYKTIGTQTWMTENLAYLPSVSPGSTGSDATPLYYVYDYQGSNVDEAKKTAFYSSYGALYNWQAALAACPPGWHLPTYGEWGILMNYLRDNGYGDGGSGDDIAKSLASTSGWRESSMSGCPGNEQSTNNSTGFNVPAGGHRNSSGEFSGILYTDPIEGEDGSYWTATSSTYTENAYYFGLEYNNEKPARWFVFKTFAFSVRCLRD